ncbi:MAG TPA: DUF2232 domain-containing protein [Longimicrobiales bacterium]
MSDSPAPRFPGSPGARAGWGKAVALGLLTAGLSTINPVLLIFVPLAFLLLALPPRRTGPALLGVVLLATTFIGQGDGTLWWFARGWSLILSAWFVFAVWLLPHLSLTMRALTAVGGATASAGLLFLVNRTGWQSVDWSMTQTLRNGAADTRTFWVARLKDERVKAEMSTVLDRFAEWQSFAYPALIAVASLAGLALAWWLWRRLALREASPFGRLRDFRFSDHLVWLAIAGLLLVVLPFGAALTRTGGNLLAFMGALYALRGFAVMLWLFGAPGLLGTVFGAVVFLLLYPLVMITTVMVGLTDTWLDLRARGKERGQA